MAAVPNLRKKLLSLSDLPAGWVVDDSDSDDDSDDDSKICAGAGDLGADTSTADKDVSFAYQGNLPFLEEDLGYFAGGAARPTAQTIKAMNSCKKLSLTEDGHKLRGTLGAMSFPKVGDQSGAWNANLSYQGVDVALGIVVFRKGNIAALIIYGDLGNTDVGQLQQIVTTAAAKI